MQYFGSKLSQTVSKYMLCCTKSTDITGKTQLLEYIRYINNKCTAENFQLCREIPGHTTGEEIFKVIANVAAYGSLTVYDLRVHDVIFGFLGL